MAMTGKTTMDQQAKIELRDTVVEILKGEPAIVSMLGGPKVYDLPPANVSFPYMTVSDVQDRGDEGEVLIHAWVRDGGHKHAHLLAGSVLSTLDDMPLMLDEHMIANMRFTVADIRREADGTTYHAIIRLRAVLHSREVA
jgi:hypothetical protein